MVFYCNLMPARFAGYTIGPIIFIRPKYKDDIGLLAHEKVHVKQWFKNPLMGLWYLFSKESRLRYEVEAYREQLKHSPGRAERFASFIANNYGLNVSQADALRLLA